VDQTFNVMPIPETSPIRILERAVERITGKSVGQLRELPLEGWRSEIETRHGRRMHFRTKFPFIGRGNVMRHNVVNHDEIESQVDYALRD
jgi:hypothetical protein